METVPGFKSSKLTKCALKNSKLKNPEKNLSTHFSNMAYIQSGSCLVQQWSSSVTIQAFGNFLNDI